MARFRSWLGGPLLGLATLLPCFVVLEVGLRLSGISPGFYDNAGSQRVLSEEHDNPHDNPFGFPIGMRVTKPDSVSELCGAPVVINKHGMRADRDYAFEKPPGTHRIMMIGDSVTFGNTPHEQSLPVLLRHHMDSRLPDGVDVQVLNFSSPGWALPDYLFAVHRAASRFEFDELVVNFVMNDIPKRPLAVDLGASKVGDPTRGVGRYPQVRKIIRHTAVGTALGWWAKGLLANSQTDRVIELMQAPPPMIDESIAYTAPALGALRDWAAERDVGLTVVAWPYAVQLDSDLGKRVMQEWYGAPWDPNVLSRHPQEALLGLCRDVGVRCLDPSPAFSQAAVPIEELYFETPEDRIDYIHFSEAGHELGARWLAQHLADSMSPPTTYGDVVDAQR